MRSLAGAPERGVTFDHKCFQDAYGLPGCRGKLCCLVVKDRALNLIACYATSVLDTDVVVSKLSHSRGKAKIQVAYIDGARAFSEACTSLAVAHEQGLPAFIAQMP